MYCVLLMTSLQKKLHKHLMWRIIIFRQFMFKKLRLFRCTKYFKSLFWNIYVSIRKFAAFLKLFVIFKHVWCCNIDVECCDMPAAEQYPYDIRHPNQRKNIRHGVSQSSLCWYKSTHYKADLYSICYLSYTTYFGSWQWQMADICECDNE